MNAAAVAEPAGKEQGIPQHILELHALAMGKQPADLLKPAMSIGAPVAFTGSSSNAYNANIMGRQHPHMAVFGQAQPYQGKHNFPPRLTHYMPSMSFSSASSAELLNASGCHWQCSH